MYDTKDQWKETTTGYTDTPGLWEDYEATPGGFLTPELSLSFHLTESQIADCRRAEKLLEDKQNAKYGYGSEFYRNEV